jgi:hypothetical protein
MNVPVTRWLIFDDLRFALRFSPSLPFFFLQVPLLPKIGDRA